MCKKEHRPNRETLAQLRPTKRSVVMGKIKKALRRSAKIQLRKDAYLAF